MWISRKKYENLLKENETLKTENVEQYSLMLKRIKALEEEKNDLLDNCLNKELQINELEELTRTNKIEKIPAKKRTTPRKTKKEDK